MAEVFSTLASVVLILVIVMYFRQIVQGVSIPNPATWLIWTVIGLINTATYFTVVDGNLFEWSITLTATIGLSTIFFYALAKGKFARVGKIEKFSLCISLAVGILWQTTGNAVLANILLQIVYLISFYPTVVGLWNGTLREKTPPWDTAVLAYCLVIVGIILNWNDTSAMALVHPIVNGIIGNGSVALMIRIG